METHNSSLMWFIVAALLVVVGTKLLVKNRSHKNGKRKYHPIGGTMFHQLLNFRKLHDYMTNLAAKYKTYRLLGPFRNEIYTSDPALVEYILRTNFDNYGKGGYNYGNLNDLMGDGIFTVDGEKWRNQRKLSSYEFSTRVLRDHSSNIFRTNVVKLANIIAEAISYNQSVDIQDLFMKSTLDSIFKVGFGVELDSLCGSNGDGTKFAQALDEASVISLYRYVDFFWPIKKYLNIGSEAKLKKSMKIVDDFVYNAINTKVELMRNGRGGHISVKKDDILSRFLEHCNSDIKYLRDIILNFVFAGKDSTSTTLSWFIYMLCKHRGVQEKVADEIRQVTSTEWGENFTEFAVSLTEESLAKMQYLHAALTETLRLYPAVPVDAKVCFSNDIFPDGNSVNKGDMVCYLPYAMGRMKFIWGDDAENFRLERWFDDQGNFKPESPFKFTSFQAGPRICLGKDFAYRQMKIFSTVLLRSFIFQLANEKSCVNYKTMLTLFIDGGLHICAYHRK